MSVVVVGVDQSEGAKAAVRFAYEVARLRDATLRAVHAWQFGYVDYTSFEGAPPNFDDVHEIRAAVEATLDTTLRQTLGDVNGVKIETRAIEGTPATVLIEESRGADILVVGTRGHNGVAQLLLGSVSQHCAHHAECPVAIVRTQSKGR